MKRLLHPFFRLARIVFAAVPLLFISCQEVIFDTIRQEIKLEDAQITGTVNSIVRYTIGDEEYLFCQNGTVWKKNVNAAIASDSTDGETWAEVTVDGSTTLSSTDANLFCTNTPNKAHRHAYLRVGEAVYELDGGAVLGDAVMETGSADHSTAPTTSSRSATVLGDTPYFSSGWAMASNETKEADATYIYYSDSDDLYYGSAGEDGSFAWKLAGDPSDVIYAMACTSDYLLLGTDDGLIHVTLSGGVPSGSSTDFDSNAESTLSSYYQVRTIIAVDPSLSETNGDLYGSTSFSGTSASFSNVVLWGYYPGRGKWNCE